MSAEASSSSVHTSDDNWSFPISPLEYFKCKSSTSRTTYVLYRNH